MLTSELISLAKGKTATAFAGAAFSAPCPLWLALLGKLLLSKLLSLALRSAADIRKASASSFAPLCCAAARVLIILLRTFCEGYACPGDKGWHGRVLPEKHAGWLLAWLQSISCCRGYCRQVNAWEQKQSIRHGYTCSCTTM